MKAAPSDQRSILEIARFDQQSTSLQHKAAHLPELAELINTNIKANNARDLRIAAETELSDVKRELLRSEADVEQVVLRITRDESRLNAGSATPKELEQLQHEIGTLGIRRAELEEVELEIMMRVDAINDRITTLRNEEATHTSLITELEVRKENALAAINNEVERIAQERDEKANSVEKAFVELYEKVRAASGGNGAAALVAGTCTGCNLSINTVELKRISESPDDEVIRCEECRCILVRGF